MHCCRNTERHTLFQPEKNRESVTGLHYSEMSGQAKWHICSCYFQCCGSVEVVCPFKERALAGIIHSSALAHFLFNKCDKILSMNTSKISSDGK